MKQQITLKKLGIMLDVSPSTVSKSLSNSKEISEDTKRRVLKMAKLHNFKPNHIASSLKTK